jgi:hypothetical protein
MKLINNEIKILESDDKSVTLTSHRIRQENKQWGKMQIKSIMLDHVTSCEYDRKSNPILLIIGLVLLVYGAGLTFGGNHGQGEIGLLAIGIGLVLIIFYWITTKKGLIVSSPSLKIIMNTNGMKDDIIKQFIDKLEEAISIKNKL